MYFCLWEASWSCVLEAASSSVNGWTSVGCMLPGPAVSVLYNVLNRFITCSFVVKVSEISGFKLTGFIRPVDYIPERFEQHIYLCRFWVLVKGILAWWCNLWTLFRLWLCTSRCCWIMLSHCLPSYSQMSAMSVLLERSYLIVGLSMAFVGLMWSMRQRKNIKSLVIIQWWALDNNEVTLVRRCEKQRPR